MLLSLALSVSFSVTQCPGEDGNVAAVGSTDTTYLVVRALSLSVMLMQCKKAFKACINGNKVKTVLL